MRYSIKLKDRICFKGYGFLYFATNMSKNLSNKYSQNLTDSTKKSTTDAIKTASKRAIQKTAEATDDLIDNKIADKITSILKYPKELHSKKLDLQNQDETDIPKQRYISPKKRQQIIDELRLLQ